MQLTLNSNEIKIPPAAQTRLWNWKDVLLISLSSIAFMLIALVPAAVLITVNAPIKQVCNLQMNLLGLSIAALAAEAIALFAAVFLFGKLRRGYSWAQLGFKPVSLTWWAASLLLTFAAAIVGGMAAVLVQLALGLPQQNPS